MMGYSSDPANLGNLPPGKPVDGCVCSPPFEKSDARKPGPCLAQACAKYGVGTAHAKQDWEPGPGNVGNDSGPTYWQAVADIYRQVWQVLKPGGVMACVVKSYVKNKTLVDLPQQTWDLLLHLGFVPVARIRAMLTKTTESPSIFGGTIVTIKKRASFFRRLAEAKGSPPIDWEEVLCVRKHV
jgi:hypothetical protein